FAVPFCTGDFDPVQTTGTHDLDALGTQTHGVLHGTLHRTTEHDALFQLLRDGIGDQLGISFWLADFFDIDVYRNAHQTLKISLQAFNVFAALADHNTRTSRVNCDACILGRTLDDHAANRSILEFFLQVFANADIFGRHAAEIFVTCIPA